MGLQDLRRPVLHPRHLLVSHQVSPCLCLTCNHYNYKLHLQESSSAGSRDGGGDHLRAVRLVRGLLLHLQGSSPCRLIPPSGGRDRQAATVLWNR